MRYQSFVSDNARWDGFVFRPGDIIISTPPKCGTTWTQMICAMLIFQTPELPSTLDLISPWMEIRLRRRKDVHDLYDAQTHRRFIKSHTPLDGLPVDDLDVGERAVVELGATKAEHQPGTTFRVFLDPAGHPFCLCVS